MTRGEPNEVVLSLRISQRMLARINELAAGGPPDRPRTQLLRELLETGIEHYVQPQPRPAPPPAGPRRNRRIMEPPPWGDELRALHSAGLTNADIAERTGWTIGNVRQRMARLGLRANRGR